MSSVRDTIEYRRVANLPRRRVTETDAAAWATVFTRRYRLPGSSMQLGPWQGMALAEMMANDGLWAVLPVGLGKTLVSYLAALVLEAERPMLIVPANLVEKTHDDFASYHAHWPQPRTPHRITSWKALAPQTGEAILTTFNPDVIIIDESDELANADSSAAAKIGRYVRAARRQGRRVIVIALTGTAVRKSIMNFWHILLWCLGDRAPMPQTKTEAEEWAGALDIRTGYRDAYIRPGVLGADVDAAREWFQARLAETPGVLIVDGDSCDAPLTIRTRVAREDPKLDEVFRRFWETLETPSGEPVTDPLSRWRLDGWLGCGLYQYFDPAPPDAWRIARRAAAKFVRETIEQSRRGFSPLDSEAQVFKRYADHPVVRTWQALKPTFDTKKNTRVAWLSTSAIESARAWLLESRGPAIIWCGSVEFGQALATALRLPYYGREGKNREGGSLHKADPKRSMVCSWHANKKGFNLQPWRRSLVIHPPQSAKWLEQLFGRHHRQGQDEHVIIDVLLTSGGTIDAFFAALEEAGFGRGIVGTTQKILRAEIKHEWPRITERNELRWATKDERPERAA